MNRLIMLNVVLLLAFSLSNSCDTLSAKRPVMDSLYTDYDYKKLGYKFFAPSSEFRLHYDLEEISALAYYKPGTLAAVQDESGRLFMLSTKNGDVIETFRFDTSGDYEGVEIIDGIAYVIESSGKLFKFKIENKEKLDVKKENTVFNSSNDIEGLGYYNGYLLAACKASGDTKDNKAKGKAIYRIDPDDLKVKKKEWLSFEEKDIKKFIKERRYFNKIKEFDPSGIAVHPVTEDVYIISADKALLVFNKNHELKEVVKLNGSIYRQAEGICFGPDGTMYISNEGEGARGKIITLNYNR